jgi:hypothetical protein
MPKQVKRIEECVRQHYVKTYLLGFLLVFFMAPIIALVAITIVGLILVPFLPLAYLFAIGLGVVAFGLHAGGVVLQLIGRKDRSSLLQAAIGVSLVMTFWLVTAVLLGSDVPTAKGFGIAFLVISIIVSSYPTLTGIGASLLTRFGYREYRAGFIRSGKPGVAEAPAPMPPPIPNGPTGHGN